MHRLHSFDLDRQTLEKPGCACAALGAQWGRREGEEQLHDNHLSRQLGLR